MKRDSKRLRLANKRLVELLAIESRQDLPEEQKRMLISQKMKEYRRHPYVAPEGYKPKGSKSSVENDLQARVEACRKLFEDGIKEGRIHVTALPDEDKT